MTKKPMHELTWKELDALKKVVDIEIAVRSMSVRYSVNDATLSRDGRHFSRHILPIITKNLELLVKDDLLTLQSCITGILINGQY